MIKTRFLMLSSFKNL